MVWRRGPSTGPRHLQTADFRFSRSERIRLELATTVPGSAAARLLDRAGQPIQVPVEVSARPDDSGQFRWIVADAVRTKVIRELVESASDEKRRAPSASGNPA